jgi:hypothetical protein
MAKQILKMVWAVSYKMGLNIWLLLTMAYSKPWSKGGVRSLKNVAFDTSELNGKKQHIPSLRLKM